MQSATEEGHIPPLHEMKVVDGISRSILPGAND